MLLKQYEEILNSDGILTFLGKFSNS